MLVLVGDDCCFVAQRGRKALLADGGVAGGDCEGSSELEGGGADYNGTAVEHASEYKLLPERRRGVGSVLGDFAVPHEEVGAWDADVVEDGIAVIGAVVGHLQTVQDLVMSIDRSGGTHTQYHRAQYQAKA